MYVIYILNKQSEYIRSYCVSQLCSVTLWVIHYVFDFVHIVRDAMWRPAEYIAVLAVLANIQTAYILDFVWYSSYLWKVTMNLNTLQN